MKHMKHIIDRFRNRIDHIKSRKTKKTKRKKTTLVISLATIIWFRSFESVEAMGLSIPPSPVLRVHPGFQNSLKKPEVAIQVTPKLDRVCYEIKSKEEFLYLIYLTDPRFASNQKILKLVHEVRGGSWGIIGTAAFLSLIILIISLGGESFVPVNLGWGLNRPDPIQPPGFQHRYPPAYDLFFPKKTCYADRPGGSPIMAGVNEQSAREELTQLSTDVVPTQTQITGFTKNEKVDLHQCLDEVYRRASKIGCTDFECSLERFKSLATENGNLTKASAREAITALQGEMEGYYKNTRRENYGPDIKGPDFIVDGIGEFQNVTHLEVKNPVGSAIKKGGIFKQGKSIGKKIIYQKNYWSNTNKTSTLENLNPTASLPQSPNNILGLVDNFDVPSSEKTLMKESILNGTRNNPINIIFIN